MSQSGGVEESTTRSTATSFGDMVSLPAKLAWTHSTSLKDGDPSSPSAKIRLALCLVAVSVKRVISAPRDIHHANHVTCQKDIEANNRSISTWRLYASLQKRGCSDASDPLVSFTKSGHASSEIRATLGIGIGAGTLEGNHDIGVQATMRVEAQALTEYLSF